MWINEYGAKNMFSAIKIHECISPNYLANVNIISYNFQQIKIGLLRKQLDQVKLITAILNILHNSICYRTIMPIIFRVSYFISTLNTDIIIIESQPLKSDDHVSIAANGHTLQIKEAQISDTGRYTCAASNLAGEDELDFDVNIQGNTTMLVAE